MNQDRFLTGLLAVSLFASSALASAPTIIEAAAKGNPNGFNLTFSEPVDSATATNAANYSVNNGVTVTGASLLYGTNETIIVVHTTDLTGTGPFTVTVNGVTDQEMPANAIAANSTAVIRRNTGNVLVRSYGGINGGSPITGERLVQLYAQTNRFPDRPDLIEYRPEFSIVSQRANDYGAQILGLLEVEQTGEYRFHISANFQGILFLSTDALAANKRPIAGEPFWNYGAPRNYVDTSPSTQFSRTLNAYSPGDATRAWITTNFPQLAASNVPINDSLYAYGPIVLEVGKRYYMEAQVKSSGADWLEIAWQRPGDLAVTNGQPAIAGSYLAPAPRPTDGSVSIIYGPGPLVTVNEGGSMVTGVVHDGTGPFEYQWFRGSQPLAGATMRQLILPFVNMNDDGAEFSVRIRNAFSEVTSEPAELDIIPDTEAPTLVRAEGSHQFDRVLLTFSEPLDPTTATDVSNYVITIEGTQTTLNVLQANLRHLDAPYPRGRTQVTLQTAPQSPGIRYRVTTANLTDRAAPPLAVVPPAAIEFTAWVLSPGFLHREVFPFASADQLDTFNFDALTNVAAPPGFVMRYIASAEDSHNYPGLSRLLGRLIPSATGNHTLGIYSLRSSRLYLDTNGVAGPLSLIASREGTGFPPAWNFESGGSQISAPVSLIAGTGYRFELIHAPTSSSVQAGVTWQAPGEAAPANHTPSRLRGSLIACFANPDAPVFQVSSQPQSQTVEEFAPVSFSASASAREWGDSYSLPLLYQWQKDGIDIPGATNSTYTIPSALVTAAGAYRCNFIVPGKVLPSSEAALTVIPHPLPELDVAYALSDRRRVIVRFTSRIGPQMATTPGLFTIPGLTVESATVRPDQESVELVTSLQTAGQLYTVNVHAIFDFDGTPVDLPVSPVQVNFTGPVLTPGFVLRETYTNIVGALVSDLTNHISFPGKPGRRDYLPGIDYMANPPVTNAGVRISGWITPPADGNYDFYIAGDFQSLLYLSTDENPANKIPIAMEPEWNNYRDFASNEQRRNMPAGLYFFPWAGSLPVNRTPNTVGPRSLQASQRYYFEVLKKKQSGGGDHVSVAMVLAGSPAPVGAGAVVSGATISSYLSPDNRITITQQPQSITIPNPQRQGQFSVGAVPLIAGPLTYQWFRNGVPVPGAVGGSVTLQAGLPGSSSAVTCRISAPGAPEVMSEPAFFAMEPVAIHLGWTGDRWQLNLPFINGTYRVERATNFPPTGGWQFLQDVPGYLNGWQFEQEFPNEFFRVELREP